VRKGQEAEDSFKRFEAQLKSFKLSLSPVVSEFAKYLGILTDVIAKGKELAFPPTPKGPAYTLTGQEKNLFSLWGIDVTRGTGAKRTPELWELFGSASMAEAAKLTPPPELPKEYPITKMGEDIWKYFREAPGFIKIIQNDITELIPVIENYDKVWEQLERRPTLIYFENIERQLAAFGTTMQEDQIHITEWSDTLQRNVTVVMKAEQYYKSLKERMDEILNTAELLATVRMEPGGPWTGAEFTYPTHDILPGLMVDPKTGRTLWIEEMKRTQEFWDSTVRNMTDSFSNNFIDSVNQGFKNIGDAAASFGMDVLKILEKMALNAALFGNIMGEKGAGGYGGLIGWIGGLFKGGGGGATAAETVWDFPGFLAQGGFSGMVNRPTAFMAGEGGESEFVSITPKSKMSMGGQPIIYNDNRVTNSTYIDALDQKSIEDRVTGPVIRGMGKPKYRDAMKNIVRRNN
jgi:hypothetical protein